MDNFIIIITFLFFGLFIKKIKEFPPESGKVLNSFVIYFSLPSLILLKIPDIGFNKNLIITIIVPWFCLLTAVVLVLISSNIFKWSKSVKGCMLLLVPLGNTAFFGIPMVSSFFGENFVKYAILYDQFGSFMCLITYGTIIISIYGKDGSGANINDILKRIISFPPFIALVIAFMFKSYSYPPVLTSILNTLSNTLIPLVMTAIGFQLSLRLEKKFTLQVLTGLSLKLIIIPFMVFVILWFFNLNSDAAKIAVFESGMPPMVTAGALAIMEEIEPEISAAMVGAGLIISFFTLPVLYKLILFI